MFESKGNSINAVSKTEIFKYLDQYLSNAGISKDILRSNLGMFLTNANLTKVMFINELYQEIKNIPGSIFEFGCHLGQNLILFENFRSIYEPFNNQRRVVAFDMFGLEDGYPDRSNADGCSSELESNVYSLPDEYPALLESLFEYHQKLSVLQGESRLKLHKGEASSNLATHLTENPGEVIALAYLDLATYRPTSRILELINDRLIPGSVIVADEINFKDYQGASKAFLEFLKGRNYVLKKSQYMTDRGYITITS